MTLLIIFAIIVFAICLYANRKSESYENIQKEIANKTFNNGQSDESVLDNAVGFLVKGEAG